jgi:hypothetical protein
MLSSSSSTQFFDTAEAFEFDQGVPPIHLAITILQIRYQGLKEAQTFVN